MNRVMTKSGLISAREANVSRALLSRYARCGKLLRLSRGVYCPADYEPTTVHEIEILLKKKIDFVVAMQSALQMHEFTTATPHSMEIAIPHGSRTPKEDFPLTVFHLSGSAWEFGRVWVTHEGVEIPIFSPAKTVADLFKFRNRYGIDLAIEGLREGIKARKFTPNEFIAAAKADRVESIVMPYLESVFQ